MKKLRIILMIIPLILFSTILTSCKTSEEKVSYNNRTYDLSTDGSASVIARSVKEGSKYTLTISGSGEAVDFDRKESVPWNPIIKSIDKIIIEDGVTKIGSYYFYSSTVGEFYLPQSLKTISANAFNENAIIYSYSQDITTSITNKIYYYSEKAPSEFGKYFHIVEGKATVWNKYKVLFVGNSFTYYTISAEDPMVPKYFKELADSLGEAVEIDFVIKGSHTLTKFSNQDDEMGKILYDKLSKSNDYTHVILQEQSTAPINSYNSFKEAVGKIKALVDKTQTNCEVVLYETWGSPTAIKSTGHKTIGAMEEVLRNAYEACAKEYGLKVDYVGKAFTYTYEVLGINIFYEDERHQNEAGAYLSAATHLASILKIDVRESSFKGNLDSELASILRSVAHKVAFNLPLDGATSNNQESEVDNENHLIVIAWYKKTATSGLTDEIMNNFLIKLKSYLKTLNYSDEEINSILIKGYEGNVTPSCEAIKQDGNVDIMIGWKSNVDTTGNLSFIESYPSSADGIGIKMGEVDGRWIHRLTETDIAKVIFNWIIEEKDNNLFQ